MTIRVQVGRMTDNQQVEVAVGTTIQNALSQAGYSQGSNEVIKDIAQNQYTGSEVAENGKGYFLVEQVKSGAI